MAYLTDIEIAQSVEMKPITEIAKSVGGEYPVILLDDVFSELDESRRHYILDSLGAEEGRQIIITSCEPDIIPGNRTEGVNFRHVVNGEVE